MTKYSEHFKLKVVQDYLGTGQMAYGLWRNATAYPAISW